MELLFYWIKKDKATSSKIETWDFSLNCIALSITYICLKEN